MNSPPEHTHTHAVDVIQSGTAAVFASPFLFVVGCPRSGTTLLQRMLNSHPIMAVANDTHFIPRALEKTRPSATDELIQGRRVILDRQLVDGVRDYYRFRRMGLSDDEVNQAAESSESYQEFVSRLYQTFARQQKKEIAGEKTPDYVRHLPLLHAAFPGVRSLHIIRDGRDVALSLLEWANSRKGPGRFDLWESDPIAVSALWWRWQVDSGREAGDILGKGCYQEVLYEQLVDDSEQSLRDIAAFLGIPFAQEMLEYHEGRSRPQPGLSAKKAWLPPTSGLRDWRSDMSPQDVAVFEALAGDLLAELGYPMSDVVMTTESRDLVHRAQDWWEGTMSVRIVDARRRLDLFAASHTRDLS